MKSTDLVAIAGILPLFYVGFAYCQESAITGMELELAGYVRDAARMSRADATFLHESRVQRNGEDLWVSVDAPMELPEHENAIQVRVEWY